MALAIVVLGACQAERDPDGPGDKEAWWEVENVTTSEIVELNLAPSPAGSDWGFNQLGEITLPPTEDFRLREVPCPKTYDMRALGDDGGEAYDYDVAFDCASTVSWDVTELQ